LICKNVNCRAALSALCVNRDTVIRPITYQTRHSAIVNRKSLIVNRQSKIVFHACKLTVSNHGDSMLNTLQSSIVNQKS
jgi:hypothetical protein